MRVQLIGGQNVGWDNLPNMTGVNENPDVYVCWGYENKPCIQIINAFHHNIPIVTENWLHQSYSSSTPLPFDNFKFEEIERRRQTWNAKTLGDKWKRVCVWSKDDSISRDLQLLMSILREETTPMKLEDDCLEIEKLEAQNQLEGKVIRNALWTSGFWEKSTLSDTRCQFHTMDHELRLHHMDVVGDITRFFAYLMGIDTYQFIAVEVVDKVNDVRSQMTLDFLLIWVWLDTVPAFPIIPREQVDMHGREVIQLVEAGLLDPDFIERELDVMDEVEDELDPESSLW